jgi:uncharacterized membrane protein YgaE (UPF0421/DUF939 family)
MAKQRKLQSLTLKRGDSETSSSFIDIDFDSSYKHSELNSVFFDDEDLEDPVCKNKRETLQDQSTRLTKLLMSKTELADYDPSLPLGRQQSLIPSDEDEDSEEKGGLAFTYWVKEIRSAPEHGGDYQTRIRTAARAALGSALTFAFLVLPEATNMLGVVWVGNIWMHVNLSDSLGASLPAVIKFARSTLITTLVTWPIAVSLSYMHLEEKELLAVILFPCMIFLLSFVILTSPQLTSNNLMLVVMLIVLAHPMTTNNMIWYKPFYWVASYFICLAIALCMNIFPFPNFALRTTSKNLKRLENDLTMLFLACKTYSENNGTNVKIARQAISTVEFMHTRICQTVAILRQKLPATRVELMLMKCAGGQTAGEDLVEWVEHIEKLEKPLKLLRSALMQKVLGEDSNVTSPKLAETKILINQEIAPSRDRLVSAMIASVAVCHAWADPLEHRMALPDVQGELKASLDECQQAFHRAMCKASSQILLDSSSIGEDVEKDQHVALFAHLTRRMSSLHSMFVVADSLLDFLESHSLEKEETKDNGGSLWSTCLPSTSSFCGFFKESWKWKNKDQLRFALKTSIGMVFASFFICMPYLKELAFPYGLWPGITIASVNLSTTGSSFRKATDRLFATLLAAAYAMLVADLFPGKHDYVKITALTLFTFVVIYLRNTEHAYMYTYSAISIGCMLFGSGKTDYDIAGYIPKRIELIFVGIIIFTLIELLMFPRSSRKIVESTTLEFIFATKNFLKQALESSQRMEEYVMATSDKHNNNNDRKIILEESNDLFHLNMLEESHAQLKSLADTLKKEMDSSLAEPVLGLNLPLHPESFRGLVVNESSTEMQSALLCTALSKLAIYYQEDGHPIREWGPSAHTQFLEVAHSNLDCICEWLGGVFVDGRIRAQRGNSVKAVSAASSFRMLEDARLEIVSNWSASFQAFVEHNGFEGSDPVAIMTLGITTTVILDLCKYLQKAGRNLEEIAYRFPTFQ